ncbi:MAG: DUF2752 domain-containing protein [Clostridiales bacterium]|jgi:hypothetical protein|nr:DUF2752 domain-containing protein [Clostridiales bacterium]
MTERRTKVIRIALILTGIGALYALFVHFTGIGIPCPIYWVTGLQCPGCGISRMFLSMLRLDFSAAFHYNSAVFCLLPVFLLVGARKVYLYIRYNKRKDRLCDVIIWILIAVLLLFGILRNLL